MIPIVNTRSYELVRDRIAEILATELPSQSTLHSDVGLNAKVCIDRIVPIDSEEVPLVNIIMGSANWDNFTQTKQDGNYVYDIDIYVGSKGNISEKGDVLSMSKLQKLTGVIQGILMHPQYNTLGFARPFIEHREVGSASLGVPNNTLDATNTTQCRLQLTVRVPENSSVTIPNNIEGWSTQVKLGLTEKGYIYSGDNIPIPDPICEVVTFVYNTDNTLLAQKTVNANDNTIEIPDIQFTDSDLTVSSVASGVNIVAKECPLPPDSLYAPLKTGETTSYYSGDDGDLQEGRNLDFYTLDFANPFGNTTRFTNDLGGLFNDNSDGSTPDYIVDNSSKLGYKASEEVGFSSPLEHLTYANNLVIGVYSDFRLSNIPEYINICNFSMVDFRPDQTIFNYSGSYCWLSNFADATLGFRAIFIGGISRRNINQGDTNSRGIYVRNHTY